MEWTSKKSQKNYQLKNYQNDFIGSCFIKGPLNL